jgi:hypothetical protein
MRTPYWKHMITYFRVPDAETEAAEWREFSKIVLHIGHS